MTRIATSRLTAARPPLTGPKGYPDDWVWLERMRAGEIAGAVDGPVKRPFKARKVRARRTPAQPTKGVAAKAHPYPEGYAR